MKVLSDAARYHIIPSASLLSYCLVILHHIRAATYQRLGQSFVDNCAMLRRRRFASFNDIDTRGQPIRDLQLLSARCLIYSLLKY